MLKLEGQETIQVNNRNFVVWGDDLQDNKFYVLPSAPRFRIQNGKPVFQFLKYRSPIERSDGPMGGLCVFDVELAIADGDRLQISEQLKQLKGKNQIEFGAISYTKGEVRLNVQDLSHSMVDSVVSPGKPSLFGNNVATFSVELNPPGTALFWNALGGPVQSGESSEGGIITVFYDLWFSAMLPPATVTVTFKSEQLRDFSRKVDRNMWGRTTKETVKDEWSQVQNGGIDVRFASTWNDPEEEAQLKEALREWGRNTMNEMVSQQLKVDLNEADKRFSTDADERESMIKNVSDFSRTYKESSAVEYNLTPQGTLQNVTTLIDEAGNRLVSNSDLGKYFRTVDLDDPFFKQVRLGVNINADYDQLKIFDVLVDLKYANKNMITTDANAQIKEGLRFDASKPGMQFVAAYQEGDVREVTYSYTINYKGQSKAFRSPTYTETSGYVTIGVDDTGVFLVNGYAKGVDFNFVKSAQVSIRYQDTAQNITVPEKQFLLDRQNSEFRIVEPIFAPRDKPFEYKVLYRMQDDSEFTQDWQSYQANDFYLNDPFVEVRTYSIKAVGSLTKIDAIFLDLSYSGDDNGYRQVKKLTLDSQNRSFDWKVPMINPAKGQVTYSGYIQYSDGNTEDIPATTATGSTIRVGKIREGVLEGTVSADGVDFENRVARAKITLLYDKQKKTFTFRDEDEEDWEFDQTDKQDMDYEWQAEVTMQNSSFGDKGKIYLPGPTQDNWGTESSTSFSLADYLPRDEDLAEKSNLLMVQILPKGIDWDEVDRTSVIIEYGPDPGRFKDWEEDDWEKTQKMIYLAPMVQQNGGLSRTYSWRAEFKMDDGERVYYPGPDKKAMVQSSSNVLYLNEYIPQDYGGELEN